MARLLPFPMDIDTLLTPLYIRNKLLALDEDHKLPMSVIKGLTEQDGKIEVDSEALMTAIGSLAAVSKTGSFDDLKDRPSIPKKLSDLQIDADVAMKSDIPAVPFIPGKLSELDNDAGYVKKSDIPPATPMPSIPAALSELKDDVGFALKSDIPTVPPLPTKVSQLDNDAGYVKAASLPNIAVKLSELTNDSGFITEKDLPKISYPVTSVNGKSGAVVLGVSAIEGLQTALDGKLNKSDLVVKYYTATSTAAGIWTVDLGTDFSQVLDVQVTALSVSSLIGGIRQASLNTYTSASKTLTGMTYGSNTITTILVGGAQGLALIPNTVVRVRVEGR